MVIVLVIVAVLAGIVGGLTLSNATMGVGIICGACLAAILARIAQASAQHEELCSIRALLKAESDAKRPKPGSYQGEFAPSGE